MIQITVFRREIDRSDPIPRKVSLVLRDAAVRFCIVLVVAFATGLRALLRTKQAVRQAKPQTVGRFPSE